MAALYAFAFVPAAGSPTPFERERACIARAGRLLHTAALPSAGHVRHAIFVCLRDTPQRRRGRGASIAAGAVRDVEGCLHRRHQFAYASLTHTFVPGLHDAAAAPPARHRYRRDAAPLQLTRGFSPSFDLWTNLSVVPCACAHVHAACRTRTGLPATFGRFAARRAFGACGRGGPSAPRTLSLPHAAGACAGCTPGRTNHLTLYRSAMRDAAPSACGFADWLPRAGRLRRCHVAHGLLPSPAIHRTPHTLPLTPAGQPSRAYYHNTATPCVFCARLAHTTCSCRCRALTVAPFLYLAYYAFPLDTRSTGFLAATAAAGCRGRNTPFPGQTLGSRLPRCGCGCATPRLTA